MGHSMKDPAEESAERTVVRDMSFLGASWGANACMVDVKDGKVLRIRPARFYDQYTKEEVKPWVMHARGKTFEPGDKTLPPPLSLAYKKRVFSPARIRFPMKRVDFDPKGERNIQNRGVSKYERISWDEALDIITGEMLRVKETYGPTAILYQNDQHGDNKCVHGPHGCGRKLLRLFGGFTHQVRNADSWEGWWWGAKHVWGCEPLGQQTPQQNLLYDIAKNAELLLFWGCDQETTTWGWGGQLVQPAELLVDRAGHQADLHRTRSQLRRRGARRSVDPHPTQYRRRALPRHRPPVVRAKAPTTRRTLRPTPTGSTSSRPT